MKRDILIFDIEGYAAHFRKFYTNSSSLSYSVPTRTSISGLIAAIMGIERDSYYDDFSKEKVRIGLRKNVPTRKIMQTLNYMKITTRTHFESPKDHTQIPFEIIVGQEGLLSYRVYISHKDTEFLDELQKRLQNKKYFYSPYLGVASFNCKANYIDRIIGNELESQDVVFISTIIPFNKVEDRGIQLTKIDNYTTLIMKEKMPSEFTKDRVIKSVESYVYDDNTNPLPVLLKDSHTKIFYNKSEENIVFM